MGWGGRWEGASGRGTDVQPWLIHVNIWQKTLQYCKVINLSVSQHPHLVILATEINQIVCTAAAVTII